MVPLKSKQISQLVEANSFLEESNLEVCQVDKSLLPGLANSINKEVQIKPSACRIDYNFFNYCSSCELKYPKRVLRCKDCNQKVRTRPWHRSKTVDRKRI